MITSGILLELNFDLRIQKKTFIYFVKLVKDFPISLKIDCIFLQSGYDSGGNSQTLDL